MKKLTALCLSLLSINAFAVEGVTIISEEHHHTAGFSGSDLKITWETRKLSEVEIEQEREKERSEFDGSNKKNSFALSNLIAQVGNYKARADSNVTISFNNKACFKNTSSQLIQFGYRFDLQIGSENWLDAQTFFLSPGYESCPKRDAFVNFRTSNPGNYTMINLTRAAEGGSQKEVTGKGILSVYS